MNKLTISLLALLTASHLNQVQAFQSDLFVSLKQVEEETQALFSRLEQDIFKDEEPYKTYKISMSAPRVNEDNQHVYVEMELDQESIKNVKEPFEVDRAVTGKDSYLFSFPINSGTLHLEIRSCMVITSFEQKKQEEQKSESGTYSYSSFGSSKSSQYLPAEVQLEDVELSIDKKAGKLIIKLVKKRPTITSKFPVSIKE